MEMSYKFTSYNTIFTRWDRGKIFKNQDMKLHSTFCYPSVYMYYNYIKIPASHQEKESIKLKY